MARIIARTSKNKNSPIISIYEAIRERKHNKKEYYDIVIGKAVFPSNREKSGKQSSFTLKNSHGMGGIGIPHQLTQLEISRLESFKFKAYGKQFHILIKEVSLEYSMIEGKYRVDCLLHLRPTCKHYEELNGALIVEVTDTHKTSRKKATDLRKENYLVVEINISGRKTWHLNNREYTEKTINWIRGYIREFLQEDRALTVISAPDNIYIKINNRKKTRFLTQVILNSSFRKAMLRRKIFHAFSEVSQNTSSKQEKLRTNY